MISATTLFCDDVRQELNNKITAVGIYNHLLIVNRNDHIQNLEITPLFQSLMALTAIHFTNDLIGEKIILEYKIQGIEKSLSQEITLEGEKSMFSEHTIKDDFIYTIYTAANLRDLPLPKEGTGEICVILKHKKKDILSGKIVTLIN